MSELVSHKEVRDVLESLLGRDVVLADGTGAHTGAGPTATAVYVHAGVRRVALLCVDLPLGAALAAALGMLPPGAAQDALLAGTLSDTLQENFYEVANIVSVLLNKPGSPHAKLGDVYYPGQPLPLDVENQRGALGRRVDVHADVKGYGAGQFSLVAL